MAPYHSGRTASTESRKTIPGSFPAHFSDNRSDIKKYFKQLHIRLVAGLIISFLIPNIILSAYFHFQFTRTLKRSGMSNLMAISESQRNTIDLFLQERVVNIFNLFHSREFSVTPTQKTMNDFLHNLKQVSDAFIDVGFLNTHGKQTGYSGPFPKLLGTDYSTEKWFNSLMNQTAKYYISDIYMGFRKQPHFTIATRQMIDNKYYVMRSTLDPDKFYMFLRTISQGKEVESTLINKEGLFQVVDPGKRNLLDVSDYIPPLTETTGVMATSKTRNDVLVAYTWLKETPWALLVMQPLSVTHAEMYRTGKILATSLVCINIMIITLILVTTKKLMDRARLNAEKGQNLKNQLIHASKLASIGELATGIAHEINNPLAIITSTCGVIKDLFNPEFHLDSSPSIILEELSVIESAAFRARGITHQLLDMGRKNRPKVGPCNINSIMDSVVHGLKEREFRVNNIEIVKNYDPFLPEIQSDADQLRQVLLNLVNNAGDAIKGPGTITLTTGLHDGHVIFSVEDTGEGISPETLKRIFSPFFTTKETGKGTGLGLSISLNLVESMGGELNAQSIPGKGSLFIVSLPISIE
jgi:two-component system NtrC family sensor kinase